MINDVIRSCQSVSPQSAPRFWTFINATLVFYSGALLLLLAFRDEGDIEYDTFAHDWYLTYDVVICLVWLFETSLTMIQTWIVLPSSSLSLTSSSLHDSTGTSSTSMWAKYHVIEWVLALYFLVDSILRIIKKSKGDDHTADMAIDVSINLVAYTYVLIAQYMARCQQQQNQQNNTGYEDTNEVYHQTKDHSDKTSPASYQLSASLTDKE